jgi:hypothetical protein
MARCWHILDKRRECAAAASAQIVNQCLGQDAPKHVIYAEVEKIVLAALRLAAAEMLNDLTEPRDN